MKNTVLLAIGFVILVIGAVVYSTMSSGRQKFRVEVCMQYQGRNACRTASAATEQGALRTAHENACALIASGVTDSIQCDQYTQPVSVKWLSR